MPTKAVPTRGSIDKLTPWVISKNAQPVKKTNWLPD